METTRAPASRPRNRRQLIVDAAGRVFNDRGYHAASLEEIAAQVGITAPALYRHFPNKYALFVECANFMADGLIQAVDALPADADLGEVLVAITRETIAHRSTGGVYRWEARYLEADDRTRLRAKFGRLVDHVADLAPRGAADLDPYLRAAAALGAIGSITMHRTRLGTRPAELLLVDAAQRVLTAEAPADDDPVTDVVVPERPAPRNRRTQILAAAIPLFAADGFANVSIGRIAEDVGIVPSGVYRHFPGKVDILAAACLQAADLLAEAVERSLAGRTDPADALEALAAAYVAYSFEHRDLTSVGEAEIVGLPPDLQKPVVAAQRDHIALWERQLRAVRPELDERRARTLVHAGLGVVVEAGRRLRWQDAPAHRDAVRTLLVAALGVPALRRPGD